MKMKAQIMLRLEVPFEYDIETLEVRTQDVGNRTVLVDPVAHERLSVTVAEQRTHAAKYAESVLVGQVTEAVPQGTRVLDAVVEEVSEV